MWKMRNAGTDLTTVHNDCFYNAGWTGDVREVITYLHQEYPEAPLIVVGTSIGAIVLCWFDVVVEEAVVRGRLQKWSPMKQQCGVRWTPKKETRAQPAGDGDESAAGRFDFESPLESLG
ncbi:unnamed protein product [Fraxinus pennsylvanica]|uniref:Serine aminopeptidase S33 domain-containing protein n=1 Tax=Fraxinus pennsylvanica TaxID=56036 RepID=A0AAD2DX29_9LAMI|nr:unnamed protein product [Fraxinus pennsylvanica]